MNYQSMLHIEKLKALWQNSYCGIIHICLTLGKMESFLRANLMLEVVWVHLGRPHGDHIARAMGAVVVSLFRRVVAIRSTTFLAGAESFKPLGLDFLHFGMVLAVGSHFAAVSADEGTLQAVEVIGWFGMLAVWPLTIHLGTELLEFIPHNGI